MKVDSNKKIVREFFKYLIPSVSAMWFFSIYTMIDGMFVGKGVGPEALAAVNISMPFINTVFAVSLLVAVGASTTITFFLGKGEGERANQFFTLNTIILTGLGILISIIAISYIDNIGLYLGADENSLPLVKEYLTIIIAFSTFFMVAYSLEVLVKADGAPIYSIIFVTLAAFINIVLDYLFVIRFGFGLKGAAYATGLSQMISCLAFLHYFIFGKSKLKYSRIKIQVKDILSIFKIGFPESLTELSAGFTTFIFNMTILRYIGSHGVAGFGVIMYINNLVIMTMIGINQGMQPLISYYNGKGDKETISKILKLGLKSVIVFSLVFFIASQVFTENLVALFINPTNIEAYEIARNGLKIFSIGFLICGFNIALSGYFTAIKETRKATLISILRGYILIYIALMIMPNIMGNTGIWIAPFVYETATLLVSLIIYKIRDNKKDVKKYSLDPI